MKSKGWLVSGLLSAILGVAGSTQAASITLNPVADGYGVDAARDGTFEALDTTSIFLHVALNTVMAVGVEAGDVRAAVEFDLSSISVGSDIESAILFLGRSGFGCNPATPGCSSVIETHGYLGDGAVAVGDLTVANPLAIGVDPSIGVDVTAFLQGLSSGGAGHAGFMLRETSEGFSQIFGSVEVGIPAGEPQLRIELASVPAPGSLVLSGVATLLGAYWLRRNRRRQG